MLSCDIIKKDGKFHLLDLDSGRFLLSVPSRREAKRALAELVRRGRATAPRRRGLFGLFGGT